MDELELLMRGNHYVHDCCVSIITESWLHPLVPDDTVQLESRTMHRWDRNENSGRSRGGGLCIYVHNNWSRESLTTYTHCLRDLESITVRCRPFYLPQELTVVLITAVYISPHSNTNVALTLLVDTINTLQQAHPDGMHIIAGDFN